MLSGKDVDKADKAVDDKSGKYAESISTSMVLVASERSLAGLGTGFVARPITLRRKLRKVLLFSRAKVRIKKSWLGFQVASKNERQEFRNRTH